jgi:type I restriction enzyme S subunit
MNIVTRASLGQELLKNLPVILPPLDEMRNIGKFIDEQIDINIKTINLVKKSIDLLKEYRSSLITHAVSGQIDISKYEVSK